MSKKMTPISLVTSTQLSVADIYQLVDAHKAHLPEGLEQESSQWTQALADRVRNDFLKSRAGSKFVDQIPGQQYVRHYFEFRTTDDFLKDLPRALAVAYGHELSPEVEQQCEALYQEMESRFSSNEHTSDVINSAKRFGAGMLANGVVKRLRFGSLPTLIISELLYAGVVVGWTHLPASWLGRVSERVFSPAENPKQLSVSKVLEVLPENQP